VHDFVHAASLEIDRGGFTASQRRDHSVVPKNAGARSRQAHEIAGRL